MRPEVGDPESTIHPYMGATGLPPLERPIRNLEDIVSNVATDSGTTTWKLDPSHSLVEFSTKHMMITRVKGRFGALDGVIHFDEKNPAQSGVEVTIDAASIDTRTEQRDEHLRSGDFLDVETFPTITFKSTALEGGKMEPGADFKLVGDLTIKDETRKVTLDATFEGEGQDPWGGQRVSFSATGKLDRRDFGLTWNETLETGGLLVGHEIKLSLEVQAVLED